jgi:hypothetical protein
VSVVEPVELSEEDFLRFLAERVQEAFGMSLEEFVAALQEQRLDEESFEVSDLAALVSARTG